MARQSFSDLSKAAFISLNCVIVWPHLEYATEANSPTLRGDINQRKRAQRLATLRVRGLRHVPYEERLRRINLLSPHPDHRTFQRWSWSKPVWFLPPHIPSRAVRHTYRLLQGLSRLRRWSVHFLCGAWYPRTDRRRLKSCHPLCLSIKIVGPSMVRNLSCSTCVIYVPLYQYFCCNPKPFTCPLPPNYVLFIWSLLALVANPTINKKLPNWCFVITLFFLSRQSKSIIS